ncbi:MAG TPA: hypothetical protein PLS05_04225 [Clostridia bacterium]|nr:hypothetical protein [Clostridia bacterium]HOL61064.1 hypothetical protein [Clostridia bacterium]HPO53976.1 hypothetical protein [Clostridia bacterium]
MAQKPLSNAKIFSATWTEKDEALLIDLLNRKINEIKFDIREAESPYIKARLRAKRKEYKAILAKVITGDYNSNVIAAELASAKLALASERNKQVKSLGKYADRYSEVDFDFKTFFGKTRYYGAGLPFFMVLILAVMACFMLISFILPAATINSIEDSISSDIKLSVTSIAYIRLGPGEQDFRVPNDGNWPKGTYQTPNDYLPNGVEYKAPDGTVPEYVFLYADLKMVSIDITAVDMLKAVFRMPMFSRNRVDFIENLDQMQGRSWYYIRFMNAENRLNSMEIVKDASGKYDWTAIVRYIATNGAVVCLWVTVILCLAELILCVFRMFTYTSRRLHVIPILILLFGLLTMIMPAFAEVEALNGDGILSALTGYFTPYFDEFLAESSLQIIINLLYLIVLVAVPILLIILPLVMHNRQPKPITFVPKGNRPHIYGPNELPVKPGQVPRYGIAPADQYRKR